MPFKTVQRGNLSRIIRINDTVYLRLGNLPIRDQCNTGILLTQAGIVLVDFPEQHPDDELVREIEDLFGKKITHIFFTHAHGDHRNGLSTLNREEIVLLASPSGEQELRRCYPALKNSILALEHGQSIVIGGVSFSVQIPALLPAHSPWDMLIGCDSGKLIFTGDFLNPPDTLYFHSSNCANWKTEMEKLLSQTEWKYFIPGHGLPQTCSECELSLRYITDLNRLWDAFIQKGASVSDFDHFQQLKDFFPEFGDFFSFWEKAGISGHVFRHLKEIRKSPATSPSPR